MIIGPAGHTTPIHLLNHRRHICMSSGDLKTVGTAHTRLTTKLSARPCVTKYSATQHDNEDSALPVKLHIRFRVFRAGRDRTGGRAGRQATAHCLGQGSNAWADAG
jgi:hypothetical protein